MPWITKEGRTVDEARDAAIAESGQLADELEIEVVNEGAKGLFGLGGEPAVVRVRPTGEGTDFRHAFQDDITPSPDAPVVEREPRVHDDVGEGYEDFPEERRTAGAPVDTSGDEDGRPLTERQEEAAALGVEIVKGILERMEVKGDITTRIAGGTVYIEVFGDEMGILIGRSGATLEALQELVRAGIQRRLKTRQAVVVDVEAYWERRRKPRSEGGEGRGGNRRGGGGGREGGGGGGGRGRGGSDRRRGGRGRRGGTGRSEGGAPQGEPDGNRAEPDGNRIPDEGPEPDGNRL